MRYTEILEACWKGYQKKGMKTMFGKRYPNCVKKTNEQQLAETTGALDGSSSARDAIKQLLGIDKSTDAEAVKAALHAIGRDTTLKSTSKARLLGQIGTIVQRNSVPIGPTYYNFIRKFMESQPFDFINKNTNEPQLDEKCWDGYTQQGMKKKGDRQVPNCVPISEQELEEDLKKWFKEKWVRFGPDGKIRGDCARGSSKEGKPKCLPQAKAQALGKKGRAASAAKKRRQDPNPERRGAAKNVATRVNEFVSGDGSGNEPDFNPETFYDIPKLKKVYKQLASRSVNSGWYDFQLTRLIGAMEDLYTINADVLDEMFPTAPEIANYIERNIIKAFPSENPPYIIKNPDYKPRVPRAAGPAVKESLRSGEYYIAQVTLDTGEVKRVKVTSDEGYDDAIRRYYAGKGRQVVNIDMDFDIQSPVREQSESIPAKSIVQGYTVFFDPSTQTVSVTQGGVDADAAIEQEQISKPTMLAFNSAVYRMISRIEDETEPMINEGIPFDQCPSCGGPIVHVTMLREKQDACYHKVKSRYKVWPSAYASGALVQCRKKGAANWGNKGK